MTTTSDTAVPSAPAPQVDVRRAAGRFSTKVHWLDSRHSFSFSRHWDPSNTHHGVLLVNNDDIVAPGAGFETHPHRDMEIVTWVLEGSLVHQDSEGNTGVIHPGLAQRMSAGTGILHSEKNDAWTAGVGGQHDVPVRFIQMWVLPDTADLTPGYAQHELADADLENRLAVVASGIPAYRHEAAISIANRFAALHVARLDPGRSVQLPDAPWQHVFVARGAVELEGAGPLEAGDAVRLTAVGGQRLVATSPAEVLLWEMHATAA